MRAGFRDAKREQQDRRAMQHNAIVTSEPTLAYTGSITSIPSIHTEEFRDKKESKLAYRMRKISPSYSSTLLPLRDSTPHSCSTFGRQTIEREAFSEGANSTGEDCFI